MMANDTRLCAIIIVCVGQTLKILFVIISGECVVRVSCGRARDVCAAFVNFVRLESL